MTRGPGGWATRIRLLCDCGKTTPVYLQDDGSLWFAERSAVAGDTVTVTCLRCGHVGTVDATELRHAIAERRRTFRIK